MWRLESERRKKIISNNRINIETENEKYYDRMMMKQNTREF